jgi:hypothetical protein
MNSSTTSPLCPELLILIVMDSSNETCKNTLKERIITFFASNPSCKKTITVEVIETTLAVRDMIPEIANKKAKVIFYFELRSSMVELYHKKLSEEVGKSELPKTYSIRPKGVGKEAPAVMMSRSLGKLLSKEATAFSRMVA